jgi:hypothetical protein
MLQVIDNVIGDKYSQRLFEHCVSLKWTFVPDISLGNQAARNVPGFSYNFFLHKDFNNIEPATINTNEYSFVLPALLEAIDKFGLTSISAENIFRSRARLTLPHPELSEEQRMDNPHIDYKIPHYVLLYYVNSTDGDTLMLDGNIIRDRITPKRGRFVLFDGSILHSSSTSTLSPRIIINNNIRLPIKGDA